MEPLERNLAVCPVLVGAAAVQQNSASGWSSFLSAVIFNVEFPFQYIKEQKNMGEIGLVIIGAVLLDVVRETMAQKARRKEAAAQA